MQLSALVGSGDRIGLVTLPFLVAGLALNLLYPAFFGVGGPAALLKAVSIPIAAIGVVIWAWSAVLILVDVPKKRLITSGPYALAKHPLYTAVALLVIPFAGFLLDSWLGVVIGLVVYLAARKYAPEEEKALAKTFGPAWVDYEKKVKMPWL